MVISPIRIWLTISGPSASLRCKSETPLRSSKNEQEVIMVFLLLVWFVLVNHQALAQQVPVIPFESVPNALKLPPNLYLGEATGVAVNSKKHIFVLSRGNVSGPAFGAAAAQLLEFGPDGRFIREIGKNLYAWAFGHTVRIDKEDNIWVTDKGSDMIVKFNPEGRVLMVFGRKQ